MKVLVTGGAGFIGSNLVDALVAQTRDEIVVLDDLSSGSRTNLAQHADRERVRIVEADVRDEAAVRDVMRKVDLVYHLAVQCIRVSILDQHLVHSVNATGTLNLLIAAREAKVSRFVYCSSSEVYGTALRAPMDEEHPLIATTPYGASKLAGEAYARSFHLTYGLPVVVVRPFNTYGAREHFEGAYGEVIPKFAVRALNGAPLVVFGDGEQTRDFTEVQDTVRGLMLAAATAAAVGEAVNIARGEEVSINEIARLVLEAVGVEGTIEHAEPRPGDVRRHFADMRKARALLGFEARTGIREGIRSYVEWLRGSSDDVREMLSREVLFNWT
jgi:UDP-glucose 4-epimerase